MTATEDWQPDGLCAQTDPEAFFPEKGASTREAKAICMGCPVRDKCLQYAMDNDERFGIWGGLSERQRHRLRRGEPLTAPKPRGMPPAKPSNIKTCQQCGTEFAGHGLMKYCTRDCRDLAYGHTRQEFPKCVVCGTGFAAQRSDAKYCSQKCSDQARGRGTQVIEVICQSCGAGFDGDKRHRFCSQACRLAGRRNYHRNYYHQKREVTA